MKRLILMTGLMVSLSSCAGLLQPQPFYSHLANPTHLQSMTEDEAKIILKQLQAQQEAITFYIGQVNKHVLQRPTYLLKEGDCQVSELHKPIVIPPKPNIKDDGSLSDSQIIKKLVNHMKVLVAAMRQYNDQQQQRWQDFQSRCLPKSAQR